MPSHLEGAGVKTPQYSAVTVSFVQNSQEGESTWSDKVIIAFKELRVDHNEIVRALVPPQESIIFIESWNLNASNPRKKMDKKAIILLMQKSLLQRLRTLLSL